MAKPQPVYLVEPPNYSWLVWVVLISIGLMIVGKIIKWAFIIGAVCLAIAAAAFVILFVRHLFSGARHKLSGPKDPPRLK